MELIVFIKITKGATYLLVISVLIPYFYLRRRLAYLDYLTFNPKYDFFIMKYFISLLLVSFTIEAFSQSWEVYNTSNSGIRSDNVTAISADQNGKMWISTVSGICSFDGLWKNHHINNAPYSYDEILNVWCVGDTIWIGTEYQGLWSFDGNDKWVDYHPNSLGNGVVGLGVDSEKTLWILDKFGSFDRWNGTSWEEIIWNVSHGNSLFVDSKDNVWLISGNSGLRKYDDGDWTEYNNTWDPAQMNYIPDASLYCMLEDSKGTYWIGGNYKGLLKFDGNTFTYFDTSNSGIASNKIRALAIDKDDNLWIGTRDNGVSKFDGNSWTNYNTINSPLSSNIINSIAIGTDDKIWIANGYNEFTLPSGGQGVVVLDENNDNSGGTLPDAPTDLIIEGISVNEQALSWSDNSTNETGFIIERSVNSQSDFQQIKFINQNNTSFTDYDVSEENTYYYRVAAMNAVGVSGYSNVRNLKPKYCTVNTSSYGCYANVTEFKFGDIHNKVFNSLNGYYNYLDQQTELSPGQTLQMTVSFDRYRITSNPIMGGEIYIDWNADGDFEDENELIFQDLNIAGKGTYIFPVHVPQDAAEGITRIRTRTDDDTYNDIEPCGYAEETQDYTLIILPKTSLSIPTDLSAYGSTSTSINLSWRDNSSSETAHKILRSSDGLNYDHTFTVDPNTIEFIDTDLEPGTKYYYKVYAVSGVENSGFSKTISAKTLHVDFEKITESDIGTLQGFTVGGFWGDYDNDGHPDVFTTGDNILFKNVDNLFTNSELTFKSSGSAAWGDYNNDGYLDLFTTSYNYAAVFENNLLYKNNGDGSFTEIMPFEADGRVNNCVWIDFNKDGKLDIFLSYLDLGYGKLYLNDGADTFSEHLKIDGASRFTTFADYDNDGDLDAYVAAYGENLLFDNVGDSTFTMNKSTLITFFNGSSNGASWGDVDNDGDLDLFVTNGIHSEENNALYLNNGKGHFIYVSSGDIVNSGGESYGSAFCDYDNDGNLDIVVTNFQQENGLYRGNGDGTFSKVEYSSIMAEFSDPYHADIPSMACAWGDYNQDGFSDLIITNTGGLANFLYKNSGNSNNWIKLKLIGEASNKSGIGAKVTVKSGDKTQYREVTTQTGFAGQNELNLNFGLGKNTLVDSIIISWPSGTNQILTKLNVNQLVEIHESETVVLSVAEFDNNVIVYPNPTHEYLVVKNTQPGNELTIELVGINGRKIQALTSSRQNTVIATGKLPKGIYLLRLSSDKLITVKKILKE